MALSKRRHHTHKEGEYFQPNACVAELCKVAAGTHIVTESLNAFKTPTMKTLLLVDMLTYDSFPALAALEDLYQ